MVLNKKRIDTFATFVLNRLLIGFFFVLLIVYTSREVSDLDLWLHLKTGAYILSHHFVPLKDIFSFTMPAKLWINHEWLFQVVCAFIYSHGSFDGLIIMQNIVIIASFACLYLLGMSHRNHVFAFVILYITLITTSYRFTIRPDIYSLFFLNFFLLIIFSFVQRKSKLIWLLPVAQVLWANMHGFAFVGPFIIFIVLIGEIMKRYMRLPFSWNKAERLDDPQIKQLLIVFCLMILAFLINPAGLTGAAYPFSVLGQISGKGRIVFQYIQELAKPITRANLFDMNYLLAYKALILISFFSFRFNQKHINISDFILWLLFLLFSLMAIRNIAYFSFVAAVVIFKNVGAALLHRKKIPFKFPSKKLKTLSTYLFIGFLFYYPTRDVTRYFQSSSFSFETYELKSGLWGLAQGHFPTKAVDFLLKNDFPKAMFNDFNSGSYLIGHAFPERQVFIDGRTEFYGPDFFKDYVAIGEGKKNAVENAIKIYGLKGFFLSSTPNDIHLGLLRYLAGSSLWKCVYFDEHAIIFLKDTKENAALIKKFGINLKNWFPKEPDFIKLGVAFRYPEPFVLRARLLSSLDYSKAAAREARIALEIQSNNAEALKYLSYYAIEQKKYKEAYKLIRNGLIYSDGDLYLRLRLAYVYYCLKDDTKAFKVIDSIIKHNPKFSEGYYYKALIVKDKNRKLAQDLLRKAAELKNKEPKYHHLLGDLYALDKKLEDAVKEWTLSYTYDGSNEALKNKIDKARFGTK